MKKFIIFLSCVVPFAVNAEGIYAGLGYGKITTDSGLTNVSGGTLDETDNSTKLTIGYELDDTFSVEGFYINGFEDKLSGPSSTTWNNADGSADSMDESNPIIDEKDAMGIALVAKTDITDDFNVLGKIGYYKWNYKLSAAGSHLPSFDQNDKDMMYGIGAEYNIDKNVALRTEYEVFKGGRTTALTDTDFDMLSASLVFRFE